MSTSEPGQQQPSLAELLQRLSDEYGVLARQELMLAKAEMGEKGKHAGVGAGLAAGVLVAAVLALGTLTAFLVAAIAVALPVWAAALIVTVLWIVVGGVLAFAARSQLRRARPLMPELTVKTMKEDVQWAKTQLTFSRR